jgi:predicted dehydrogenase
MTGISIIGGGRWARTIATVLSQLPGAPQTVLLHSRHNSKGVADWIADKGLEGRLSATSHWPDLGAARPSAAIIASRVADHVAAASAILDASIPVLVEKPVAIPQAAIRRLMEGASRNGVFLAASHVFLFARYFDAFAERVKNMGQLNSITVEWMDGRADMRYGEIKSYDARVTVFDDVLPHIVPLATQLCGIPMRFRTIDVRRGGAEVSIQADARETSISIAIARDATRRYRAITVEGDVGVCRLDFSQEPGVIEMPDGSRLDGDPFWETKLKPLGAMLTAFLAASGGAVLDERLSAAKALESAAFADVVRAYYASRQARWLMEKFTAAPAIEQVYAMQELGLSSPIGRHLQAQDVQVLLEAAVDI